MNPNRTIGVDLGGTKMAIAVVDEERNLDWSNTVGSTGRSQEEIMDLLAEQIGEAREAAPDVTAVGLGIPATIDFERGVALGAVNLEINDIPVTEMIHEAVGLPVFLDNDANVAMLAEALHGAAEGARHALMLTIGTGIGGGLWLDGEIYRGSSGAGAELGHVVIDSDGPRCQGNCPGRGCVESLASGTALGREGALAAEREPDSELGRMAAGGVEITGRQVTEAAIGGDRVAREVLELVGTRLGVALTSLANVFQPEVMVIGGGVIAAGELLLEPARRTVASKALGAMQQTPVLAAEMGPEAGVIGAAALARRQLEKSGGGGGPDGAGAPGGAEKRG